MYWKPKKEYNKKFEYDRSGLTIFAYGPKFNNFYIKNVADDSPAMNVGLKEGDIILKFNGKKNTSLNLGKIHKELRNNVGKNIKIKVLRGEEEIEFEFELEDLFSKSLKKPGKSNLSNS
jgi:C-terminal processing protease CtpA/Prc